MKILTQLSATSTDGTFTESRGILQSVQDEPKPGFFRLVSLGGDGVQIRHADKVVAIPLSELLTLVQTHEPGLIPPPSTNLEGTASSVPTKPTTPQ